MSDDSSTAPMTLAHQNGVQPSGEERLHKNTGWRLYLQMRVRPGLSAPYRSATRKILAVFRHPDASSVRFRLCVCLPCHPGTRRLYWFRRRRWSDDRILDERAVEHVQPAVLGEGTGQPGIVYHVSPSSMMAILLGMALGGLLATTFRALVIIVVGKPVISKFNYAVSSFAQLFASLFPDHDRPVWSWDDGCLALSPAQP